MKRTITIEVTADDADALSDVVQDLIIAIGQVDRFFRPHATVEWQKYDDPDEAK